MENAPLTLRDYKKISIHFLAGNFAPDTIYRMATGINELPMIVEKAIRAHREVQAQPASIIKTMETEAQKRLADEMLKANEMADDVLKSAGMAFQVLTKLVKKTRYKKPRISTQVAA